MLALRLRPPSASACANAADRTSVGTACVRALDPRGGHPSAAAAPSRARQDRRLARRRRGTRCAASSASSLRALARELLANLLAHLVERLRRRHVMRRHAQHEHVIVSASSTSSLLRPLSTISSANAACTTAALFVNAAGSPLRGKPMSVLIGSSHRGRHRRELVVRVERRVAELVRAVVELVLRAPRAQSRRRARRGRPRTAASSPARSSSSRITWKPNSVRTGALTSPTCIANSASSNGPTSMPRPIQPRSPPCAFVPASAETSAATAAKSSPLRTRCDDALRLSRERHPLRPSATSIRMWPRAALLGRLETLALFFVGGAQVLVADLDGRRNVGQRELDVLEVDGLGGLIARLIVLVARA